MIIEALTFAFATYLAAGVGFVAYMHRKGAAPDELQYLIGGVVFWPGIAYNIPKWPREKRTRMD